MKISYPIWSQILRENTKKYKYNKRIQWIKTWYNKYQHNRSETSLYNICALSLPTNYMPLIYFVNIFKASQ